MYHLLSHLADPSGWADVPDLEGEARQAAPLPTNTTGAMMLRTQNTGTLFRAPAPRLHVGR